MTSGADVPVPLAGAPERCFDALDGDGDGWIDEGCGVPGSSLQFVIAWDEAADVDLEVFDPSGDAAEPGRPTTAGLVDEHDCPADPVCAHGNYENVYVDAGVEPPLGLYLVYLRLESLGTAEPPVEVTLSVRGPAGVVTRRVSLQDEREVFEYREVR